MLTLMQFICMDDIGMVYRPFIMHDWTLVFYFTCVILVVGIVLMNLVTAVLVNGALEQANQDKEALKHQEERRKKKLMKSLREMFVRLDEDGSGQVDREEILSASEEDKALLNEFLEMTDPIDIFNKLDVDDRGYLDIDEFCDGLYQATMSKTPIELKRMDKRMNTMSQQLSTALRGQDALAAMLSEVHQELRAVRGVLDSRSLDK